MTVSTGKHEVEMRRDLVEMTAMTKPDLKWRFVDAAGHIHVWIEPDKDRWDVPTVHSVESGSYYEDGEPIYHEVCRDCGERIQAGTLANYDRQFMPGLMHYTIDGEAVSKQEALYTAKTGELLPPKSREHARPGMYR